jgi:DNA-binding PadR family transcriptional regulator
MRPFALSRDTFHILAALADGERHGYAIMRDVGVSPSTLYSSIKRLLEAGYIEELQSRPDPAHDDERRRYYRLTKAGRRAAVEEARQWEKALRDARSLGLLPKQA